MDTSYIGSKYTWYKKLDVLTRKWAMLDRILINTTWGSLFATLEITRLPNIGSYHNLLLISCKQRVYYEGPKPLGVGICGPYMIISSSS